MFLGNELRSWLAAGAAPAYRRRSVVSSYSVVRTIDLDLNCLKSLCHFVTGKGYATVHRGEPPFAESDSPGGWRGKGLAEAILVTAEPSLVVGISSNPQVWWA